MSSSAKVLDFHAHARDKLIAKKKHPYDAIPFSKMSKEDIEKSMQAIRDEDRD